MTASLPPPVVTELLGESRWVRALAQSLVADPHDADDLAQDACVIALRNPPSHGGNVRAWLRLVMQNLLRQRARSTRRREDREQRAHAGRPLAGLATDELVERATAHRAVVDAVLALAPPFRDVVLLRWFEDQPPRAIAQRLRIPVATVHSRLQRATQQLRKALDRGLGSRARWQRALLPLPSALPGLPALPAVPACVMPLGVLAMNTKVLTAVAAVVVGSAAVWIGLRSPTTAPEPARDTPALATGAVERSGLEQAAAGAGERVAVAESAPAAPPAPADGSRQIAGRVVDADGRPAPGVNLRVGDGRATSDATGAFALASPADGMLVARADEPTTFTVLEGVVRGGAAPPPVLVVVAPAVRLAGHVRDGRGAPVAEAALQVVWPADLRSRLRDVSDAASEQAVATRCRKDGDFALAAGAVRGAELLASAPGHVPHRRPLPDRDESALAIVLERLDGKPGTLQGQVVDPHGRAVADARVGLGAVLARSDAAGNFVIEDDGKGKAVAASAAGHRRAVLERGAAFPTFVLLTLGPTPLVIEGRVVDENGKGLADIMVWPNDPTLLCSARDKVVVEGVACGHPTAEEVRARFERGEFKGMQPQQVMRTVPTAGMAWVGTRADGSFTLGGLEDRPYRLRALDHETVLMTERSGIAAGARGVELVLDQSQLFTEVKGVVVARRDGSPVPGVRVRVQIDTQKLEGNTRHENAVAVATTDEHGRFSLPRVPKAWAYLRLDGDKILPSEPGRGQPGGLLELSGGRPLEFRLEVGLRMHVQVELLDPQRADSIAALDSEGRTVILNVFEGRGRTSTDQLPLAEGRSPVFVLPDTAAVLVLRKDGKEVAREPLNLRAGDVNSLRL